MDLILIIVAGLAMCACSAAGYLVGRDTGERAAADTVASLRAKQRRLERDLFMAYEETRLVRRAKNGES